jgi:hypothetical protein
MTDLIDVTIRGRDIFEKVRMPVVPRKGDHIWLSSLTMGRADVSDVVVSRVEWARDQTAWARNTPHEGIHAWVTVRRTKPDPEDDR